ncbi:MAG: hypothetical protein A2161_18440 [Candidatus Schekmanbacteria bacterium RBG_13_48_7]|uniref:PIN domain-containing protein n=1 Tax=Candidatus Schekmanbacteria bacterium RBG_13_48_7 TaxID=1817878 RepID=A0A1F7RND3_9BACT|nr:MAG: hypothetical protein A2161_18440 [Candidatus Schekmanbacteria bacterium RBG_13_48_7]
MRAFIDTSALVKKYVIEKNSDKFEQLLTQISEIIVSPVYIIEIVSAIDRKIFERTLKKQEASVVLKESKRDYQYFSRVIWNNNLEQKALEIVSKHHLETLDSIQLASCLLAGPDVFIVSDKQLCSIAEKEFANVIFL